MCSRTFIVSVVLFIICFFFIVPLSAHAVTVSIVNAPTTITQDDFTVTASISGAQAGTNYLRIDLYKDGTTNYFGETYNKANWYSGSDGTQYFPVTIPTDLPATLLGHIGNPTAGQFDNSGIYKLRIRRYTASGNPGSSDTMDSVVVAIVMPTATPTPAPTNTPAPATATPTNKPNPTPTTKPANTPTSASKVSPTLLPTVTTAVSSIGAVLGTMSAALDLLTPTVVPTIPTRVAGKSGISPFAIIFSIAGFCLILACGILILFQLKKSEKLWWKKS